MKSILKTELEEKFVEVFFLTPDKVLNQFDFIKVHVDGKEVCLKNGFLHGTALREMGVLCKQTCIGLSSDLVFSVADSKKILNEFNLHLAQQFENKKVPFKFIDTSSWLNGIYEGSVDSASPIIQSMYFYFKRAANLNQPNQILCNISAELTDEESKFLVNYLSYSPYLLKQAEQKSLSKGSCLVDLDSEIVYHSIKQAVVQINNHRNSNPSVMDAKHPVFSDLFKDDGPCLIQLDGEDIPI